MEYTEAQPFTCQGSGQLRAYKTNDTGSAALADWLLEQNYASLTAQIDGVMTHLADITVTGLAVWPGQEPAVRINNENITELKTYQCQVNTIPGSSQASVTFTAETSDGQELSGGGIMETGATASGNISETFQCSMDGIGQMTRKYVVDFGNGFKGTDEELQALQQNTGPLLNISIPSLRLRSGQEQQIMFETFMTAIVRTDS